jgi:hypothetical protein
MAPKSSTKVKKDTATISIPLTPAKRIGETPNPGKAGRSVKCIIKSAAKVIRPKKKATVAKKSVHRVTHPSQEQARQRLLSAGWKPEYHRTTQEGINAFFGCLPNFALNSFTATGQKSSNVGVRNTAMKRLLGLILLKKS